MDTFCYQCEQTVADKGCTATGNCGKDPQTSALQDLVVHAAKGIAQWAHRAARLGAQDPAVGREVLDALFATVTNVDFDPSNLEARLRRLGETLERARSLYQAACDRAGVQPEEPQGPAQWQPSADLAGQAGAASLRARLARAGSDAGGLQELVAYGLKGTAAYAGHAAVLGREDPAVYAAFFELLDLVASGEPSQEALLGAALRVGELNLKVMGMLDEAHTSTYGHPTPTRVRISAVKGKAILVSGHDLRDLELLLRQTEGRGINVYTHGEMLPAHGYPGLHRFGHLVGNWGGAWQDQTRELGGFPGAILFTTNCIQAPLASYKSRVFASGLVAYPGVRRVTADDFSAVIAAALEAPGFPADEPERSITVGFGHQAVLAAADKIIQAVKQGAIRHFFLIGGCDGAKAGRNYFTRLARAVPQDCAILTLACGKYRFNKLEFGDIGGIPRLLDIGQCNDAYAAVQIASALAKAFGTDVNGLPLSLVISWYEQKAVAVLLTLLHLGIQNIRLGPSLPAFLTPKVLGILVEKFKIKPIGSVEGDLEAMLGG
jgi:hydroxylamine reductase